MPGQWGPQWNNPSQASIDEANQIRWQQGKGQWGGGAPNSGSPQGPGSADAGGSQIQNQQFGSMPGAITNGGLVAPTSAAETAARLSGIMGRQAPQIAGADYSGMGNTQASQMGLLAQLKGYAQGLGPSAAQIGNTMQMGQAAQAGRAGIAGNNPLAARAGLGVQSSGLNSASMQGAQARSSEQGQMMGALGSGAQGMTNQALGASSLANQQIAQQQALGLGQQTRNYQLANGIIGTGLQMQQDRLNFAAKMAALQQQRQNDIVNSEIKIGASSAQAAGTGLAGA